MAFLADPQDQAQQQNQQQNQLPGVPQIPSLQGTSGPSTGSGSGAGPGTTNTASPAASPTTPWQNITTYLNANSGQAGEVANSLAQNLQGQYNAAHQAIQNENQNFNQQVQKAQVPYNQSLAQQAATSPGQFVQNPDNVSAFQKMWNANYSGPQDFSHTSGYSNLQNQVLQAQKNAALVNQGTSGIQTLLQQTEGAKGQTPSLGTTALDALLLGEDSGKFATLSQAAAPFSGLTDYLSQTQQGLDTAAKQAAQQTAATRSQIQDQFIGPNGAVPAFQNNMNTELQKASQQATNYNSQIANIISDLGAGTAISPDVTNRFDPGGALQALNPFGMSGGVYQDILAQGFPGFQPGMLAQYYTAPQQAQTPTMANVMTGQQWADANALNQLVGQNGISVPEQLGTPFSAPMDFGSYNDTQALQDIENQLNSYSNVGGVLSKMSPEQQGSWLADVQQISSYLGQPTTLFPNATPLPGISTAPTPTTPTPATPTPTTPTTTPTPVAPAAPAPILSPTLGGGPPGSGYNPNGTNTTTRTGGRAFR